MKFLNLSLFFSSEEVPALRERFFSDHLFQEFRKSLLAVEEEATLSFLEEKVETDDPLNELPKVTALIESHALLYLMTGEDSYARLCRTAVSALFRFPVWDFFLSDHEVIGVQRAPAAVLAVCLACDWLGPALPPEEMKSWLEKMQTMGCQPCYRGLRDIRFPRKAGVWKFNPATSFFRHRPGQLTSMLRRPEITATTNLRAVPASALLIGAVASETVFGQSEERRAWQEMGLHALQVFESVYETDGSYEEGINYAHYTTLHILQAVEVWRRHGSKDLVKLINWSGYARFLLHLTLPVSHDPFGIVNFGDSGNFSAATGGTREGRPVTVQRAAAAHWIARENGDGLAQWLGRERCGEQDLWSFLWFDPQVEPEPPIRKNILWINDLDWVVARTGWEAKDLVLALRSGPPANHEHADRNSLILKCGGEILVADPCRPPYAYNDPAWVMRLTDGHSGVLVDGRGHGYHNGVEGTSASWAKAKVLSSCLRENVATFISDATQPYRLVDTDITEVVRHVQIDFSRGRILILDCLAKETKPSSLETRYFGYNNDGNVVLQCDGGRFTIRRPRAALHGFVCASTSITGKVGELPVPAKEAACHPFVSYTTADSLEVQILTVLFAVESSHPLPSCTIHCENNIFTVLLKDTKLEVTRTYFQSPSTRLPS